MSSQDDDVPPLDPVKVTVFVLLLGAIGFAGWRFMRAQSAVAAVAEASKDYRKLFPARSSDAPEPPPKRVEAPSVQSGIGMLKIDDDMRAPKPAPAAAPEPPKEEAAPAPVVEAKVQAAAPVRPARKAFNQPRLNSGGISGLNGGSGVGLSGGGLAGGGGGGPTVAPGSVDPAAAAAAAGITLPALPPAEKK